MKNMKTRKKADEQSCKYSVDKNQKTPSTTRLYRNANEHNEKLFACAVERWMGTDEIIRWSRGKGKRRMNKAFIQNQRMITAQRMHDNSGREGNGDDHVSTNGSE